MAFLRKVAPTKHHPRRRWQVLYTADGRQHSAGIFDKKGDAMLVKARIEGSLVAGDDPSRSRTLFGDYFEQVWWPGWKANHPDSSRGAASRLNKRVLPLFGNVRLCDIDASSINAWKGEMKQEGLSARTINSYLGQLGVILNAAVDDGYLPRSPLMRRSGVGRAVKNEPIEQREVWLSAGELHTLAEAMEERYRALVLLGGLTGLRWGELIALRWRDLELDNAFDDGAVVGPGRLKVTKAITSPTRTGQGREKRPKTKAGRRTIALDQESVDILLRHRSHFGGGPDDLIFTTPGGSRGPGGVPSSNNFGRAWKVAVEGAGLADRWSEFRGLHFHDLRHTHATWLVAERTPVNAVARRLGHASPVVTMMVYAHVTTLLDSGALTPTELGVAAPAPVIRLRPVSGVR